jgi:hypothetical protein
VTPELALLDEVARGAYLLAGFGPGDVAEAAAIVERYRDLEIGLGLPLVGARTVMYPSEKDILGLMRTPGKETCATSSARRSSTHWLPRHRP